VTRYGRADMNTTCKGKRLKKEVQELGGKEIKQKHLVSKGSGGEETVSSWSKSEKHGESTRWMVERYMPPFSREGLRKKKSRAGKRGRQKQRISEGNCEGLRARLRAWV